MSNLKRIYGNNPSAKSQDGKFHYVYRITNLVESKHYYGVRSSRVNPKLDLGTRYFSSSSNEQFIQDQKSNPKNYKYKVIRVFESRKEAGKFEVLLHIKFNISQHLSFYNKVKQTSEGWTTEGSVTVKDKNGIIYQVSKDDPRYLSGELVHTSTGMVATKNSDGEVFIVRVDDPRYLSGELVSVVKDTVVVKDEKGNIYRVPKDDPRYLSGELVSPAVGTFNVKDKHGNISKITKDDPRYLSGELKGAHSGTIWITDGNTNNRIKAGEPIPEKWRRGMTQKR